MGKKRTIAITPVGDMILAKLKEKGLTQQELSELSGVQPPTISDIIAGRRSITPDACVAIAIILGMDAIELGRAQSDYEIMQVLNPILKKVQNHSKND